MPENRPIRIRWATWWPVPYWIERFNALADGGNVDLEVIFLSSKSRLLPTETRAGNWRFRYKIIREENAISGYSRMNRRLPMPWLLVCGSFDVLVMPYGDPDFVSAAMLCAAVGKPYCLYVPNNELEQRRGSFFRERLKHFIYRHSIGALVTGMPQRDYARKYLGDRRAVRVVGNPAPRLAGLNNLLQQGRDSIRGELGWAGQFVVLYVGRFSQEKGLHTLMEAMELVRRQGVFVRAVLIGAGPIEQVLRQLANNSGLDVEFPGFLEGAALAKRYVAADVFILPSLSEAWGLVVNEAMEAGLPLIVSDRVGGRHALVRHGENGIVFHAGDPKALAAGVIELYKRAETRELMSRMSAEIIQEHTVGGWVENVVGAVRELVAAASQGRKV